MVLVLRTYVASVCCCSGLSYVSKLSAFPALLPEDDFVSTSGTGTTATEVSDVSDFVSVDGAWVSVLAALLL